MSEQIKSVLKSYFETGDVPTQSQFSDLVDSLTLQSQTDAAEIAIALNTEKVSASLEVIIVTQDNFATTLGGTIDSTKLYQIDGIIDTGTTSIEIPATGLSLRGNSFDLSGLTSSEENYTMFTSPIGGSGNLLGIDYYVSVTGASSKVYDITDATGFNAFELIRINYINCVSLGTITNYRQGLENGTGRFGGSPSLTLAGTWLGGYRIATSIIRSMSDTTEEPLFKAGAAFLMYSRFLTDINCDLGTLQPFTDFSSSNFPNESTMQFKGVIMTRDGVANSADSNITPNLLASGICCDWDNNVGMNNTFVGGALKVSSEALTTITTINVGVPLAGTWVSSDLQHFDSPSNGVLRHIGVDPKEYRVSFNFSIQGTSGDSVKVALMKEGVEQYSQTRVVNNLQGARDVAYFSGVFNISMNQNDEASWYVVNTSGTDDVTAELDSQWIVEER
jgi:hypothetical protein